MIKKISVLIFSILVGLTAYGQQVGQLVIHDQNFEYEKDPMALKNEIHFNLLTSVLGLPEINYERFLESNFSVGMSAMAALDGPEEKELRALFTPFGRLYFGSGTCEGFYIEGNGGIILGKYRKYNYYSSSYTDPYQQSSYTMTSYTNFGLGVAVGYKFLTKNNWVGDIFAGAGRVFGDSRIDTYPRVGISIGKRF